MDPLRVAERRDPPVQHVDQVGRRVTDAALPVRGGHGEHQARPHPCELVEQQVDRRPIERREHPLGHDHRPGGPALAACLAAHLRPGALHVAAPEAPGVVVPRELHGGAEDALGRPRAAYSPHGEGVGVLGEHVLDQVRAQAGGAEVEEHVAAGHAVTVAHRLDAPPSSW
ncbi:hypothetical protein GCM10012276_22380 [Nocardioides deserti]|nr:hypothetical protein GCM10012276_22380 [Nocardioides deserti]